MEILAEFGFKKTGERRIKRRTIEKSIMYGGGYIEKPKRIAGKMLPIIPLYGWRSYIDNQEWFYGLVLKKMDAQRAINMAFSNNVENAASSPKSMPILTAEQVSGLETRWSEQHLGKYNYAVINGRDAEGEDLPLGPVGMIQPAQVDPNSQTIIESASAYIQGSSGTEPADVMNPDASGKAIQESIARINMLTYELMDNIGLFLKQVGKVYIGMAEEVYSEQRFMHLVNEDESEEMILLQKFIPDPKNPKGFVKVNDITKKTFETIVDVGPSYQNMRREVVNFVKEIIQSTPPESPYQPLLYGTLIENIEGVGMDDLKKFDRQQMLIQGFVEPETDEEKQMVMQIIQARQQQGEAGDPTQRLILAESQRAASEATENEANAANKAADTRKKLAEAEAQEIENAIVKSGLEDLMMQAQKEVGSGQTQQL